MVEHDVSDRRFYSGTWAANHPRFLKIAQYLIQKIGDLSFTYSDGNTLLMSAITSDTTLLAAALNTYSRNLAAGQQVIAGQRYAMGVIVVTGAAAPTLMGALAATAGENSISPQLCSVITGQTDLPASITAGSLTNTQSLIYAVAVGA